MKPPEFPPECDPFPEAEKPAYNRARHVLNDRSVTILGDTLHISLTKAEVGYLVVTLERYIQGKGPMGNPEWHLSLMQTLRHYVK